MNDSAKSPLKIGWESVKANVLPLAVLWVFAAALAGVYWLVPGASARVDPLEDWMSRNGWKGVVVSQLVFTGMLPWLFYAAFRSIRPKRKTLTCVMQVAWGCAFGVLCNWFFHVQDFWFGPGETFSDVVAKTLVDQFGWTVLLAPPSATFFFWLGRDMSFAKCRADWPRNFLRELVLPNLLTNWCIGIPSSLSVYSFPAPLRIVACGLIGTFWTLVLLQIGKRSARGSQEK